jgi:hypothetical protein
MTTNGPNQENTSTGFVHMVETSTSAIEQQRRPLETSDISTPSSVLQDSYTCFPDSQQETIASKETIWCT